MGRLSTTECTYLPTSLINANYLVWSDPSKNSIVFGQCPHPNCLAWSHPSKIQYSLINAHIPTVLCVPTLRKFNSLWSIPTSQLSCVVRSFENSIVFGECPHPNCLVWSNPSKSQ